MIFCPCSRVGFSCFAFGPILRAHGRGRGGEGGGKNADLLLTARPGVRPEGQGICSPLRAHRLDIARKYGGRATRPRAF